MGYTHYWYIKNMRTLKKALPLVAADLKRLLPQLPPLAGWDGQGKPTLKAREIVFNGVSPEDYETFLLEARAGVYMKTKKGFFGFCKTNRRPYDLAVQAALVLLKWHSEGIAPDAVEVDSDGNLADWGEACALVGGLGYPVDPVWLLERRVWRASDRAEKIFYLEWSKRCEEEPTRWLEELHRYKVIPFTPPFRLEGLLEGGPPGRPLEESSRIYLNA